MGEGSFYFRMCREEMMGISWSRDRWGKMGLAQGVWVVYSGDGNV